MATPFQCVRQFLTVARVAGPPRPPDYIRSDDDDPSAHVDRARPVEADVADTPVATRKLMIPHAARAIVPRSELVARLDDPSWRLGVVSAPAGFGKSMLLSSWALDRVVRPAWFSCDPGDAEPLQFWKGLIASVSTRWPGVGDDATVVLGRSTTEEQRAAISLANDLADVATPPVLVIDDLHLAKPTPSVLSAFIGALPPEVRLVIGSRKQSPFSLARRRLSGDLLELRTEDLRFSTAEAAALLGHHAIELTPTDVVQLQEMTEGWPAALQLAAMSLRRASERDRFLGALGSTEGPMADFLVSEVLAGLPDDWVEFLLVTSVLDEFDIALCERMTGAPRRRGDPARVDRCRLVRRSARRRRRVVSATTISSAHSCAPDSERRGLNGSVTSTPKRSPLSRTRVTSCRRSVTRSPTTTARWPPRSPSGRSAD